MNKSRPLRRGAIAGTLLFAIGFIYIFFSILSLILGVPQLATQLVSIIFTTVLTVLSIFYYKAIIILAERNKAKLLKVISAIGIVLSLFFGVLSAGIGVYQIASGSYETNTSGFSPELANAGNTGNPSDVIAAYPGSLAFAIALIILAFLSFVTLSILGGVGMLKVGDKFPIAKTIGILNIAAGGLAVTIILAFISIILLLISAVMKIVLLFNASKFYKE